MQVRIHGQSVAIEYSSNAEIARHIKHLTEMLQNKLEDPRRMSVAHLQFIDAHGYHAGDLVHRTEF